MTRRQLQQSRILAACSRASVMQINMKFMSVSVGFRGTTVTTGSVSLK